MSNSSQPAPPPGIQPLFLATATCDLFQLKELTAEQPRKLLGKQQLLQDIQQRRAVSDFQPYREAIQAYPGDELLVVLDAEWIYGQNFYLCLSVEAADAILNPKKPESASSESAVGPDGTSKRKQARDRTTGWQSLGSDKEIDAERVQPRYPPLTLLVSRPIREFRRPVQFDDGEERYAEFKYANEQLSDAKRVEISVGTQAIPEQVDEGAQTDWYRPVHFAQQYEPNELPADQLLEIQVREGFSEMVKRLERQFEWAVRENALVDLFVDQYAQLDQEEMNVDKGTTITMPEVQSFTDLKHTKNRSVTCVQWHPLVGGVLAVSCTPRVTLDEKIEQLHKVKARQSLITFWSLGDPLRAQLFLEAPDDVLTFVFHPTDPWLVYAGCSNGQIAIWDISEYQDRLRASAGGGASANGNKKDTDTEIKLSLRGELDKEKLHEAPVVRYSALSAIDVSHKGALTDLAWLPAGLQVDDEGVLRELSGSDSNQPNNNQKEQSQLISLSLDGDAFFWESVSKREFKTVETQWRPFYRMSVTSMDGTYDYGATKLSLSACLPRPEAIKKSSQTTLSSDGGSGATTALKPIASTKFYCGTEEGDLIYGNWIVTKNKEDKENNTEAVLSQHFGAISDVQRSPFFADMVLSLGGWSLHLWRETVLRGSLLSYELTNAAVTVAQWSLTRPGVFFVGRTDGVLEIWDLMDRCDGPLSTQTVSAHPIASLSINFASGAHGTTGRRRPSARPNNNADGKSSSSAQKQFLAVGDDYGTLFVLDIPKRLTKPQRNEQALVRALFDREVKRLGYVSEQRVIFEKARALLAKKQEELAKQQQQQSQPPPGTDAAPTTVQSTTTTNAPSTTTTTNTASAPAIATAKKLAQFDRIEKDYQQLEKSFLDAVAAQQKQQQQQQQQMMR